jgi:hypothetical protein
VLYSKEGFTEIIVEHYWKAGISRVFYYCYFNAGSDRVYNQIDKFQLYK